MINKSIIQQIRSKLITRLREEGKLASAGLHTGPVSCSNRG